MARAISRDVKENDADVEVATSRTGETTGAATGNGNDVSPKIPTDVEVEFDEAAFPKLLIRVNSFGTVPVMSVERMMADPAIVLLLAVPAPSIASSS